MLRSDLRALRNLARTGEGRKALLGHAVVTGCIALGSAAMASLALRGGRLRQALQAHTDGDVVRSLHALVLSLPLVLVAGVGTMQFAAELYRAPQVPVLLAAPVRSRAIVLRAFLRSLFGWWVFASAVTVPATLRMAEALPWSPWVAPVMPVAVLALLAPLLALQLLLKVVLTRWCSGARWRAWFQGANIAICTGLVLALLFGLLQGRAVGAALGRWVEGQAGMPWILAAPAALPAAAAGFAPDAAMLWATPAMVLLAALPLLLAARLYRPSYDAFCQAGGPAVSRRAASRSWPVTPLRSLLAKMRVQVAREPSNLAFYFVLAAIQVLILAQGTTQPEFEARMPSAVHESFFLLLRWQGLAALTATLAFLGVVGDEQRQIGVLATAPVVRRDLLHAKLVGVAMPFVATLALTLVSAPLVAGVGGAALAGFLLGAVPMLLYDLGWLLLVGSWPAFVRVHDALPLANNLRSTVPVIVIGAACGGALLAVVWLRGGLVASYYGHGMFAPHDGAAVASWLLAVAWLLGVGMFALGYRIARANFEVLLGPQPE